MSYEIYRITARCKCPCGKGEIIRGDSMNDWNQTRSGDIEIHCPECSNKLKFTDGGLIDINYPDYSGDPNCYRSLYLSSRSERILSCRESFCQGADTLFCQDDHSICQGRMLLRKQQR